MRKSRQYSSPPQVSQQKKGTNEHFWATDALDAAADSKGTQKLPETDCRRGPLRATRAGTPDVATSLS